MIGATAYLGTGLFFSLVIVYFNRLKRNKETKPTRLADISLRVDRSALLAQQRQLVTENRARLYAQRAFVAKTSTSSMPPSTEESPHADVSDGFSEDLGAAFVMIQQPAKSQNRSRFKVLEEAADELAEAYRKHSKIEL